jgi:hypothetical protein
VLEQTIADLATLRPVKDEVSARELSRVIVRDPLMTLSTFAWSARRQQKRRHLHECGEIETVEGLIIMNGVDPFFEHFCDLEPCSSRLKAFDGAYEGLSSVIDRGRLASAYAADWAVLRKDLDAQVIQEAALLHDAAELLVWCAAPVLCLQMKKQQSARAGVRSVTLQKAVLGVCLNALAQELFRRWRFPSLLQKLTNDRQCDAPAIRNVNLAVNLARHLGNGWDDPALADDYREIGKLLNVPPKWVEERVRAAAAD